VDLNTVSQIVTVVLAVLTVIWHQQRTTDKLRDRLDASDREHRAGLSEVKQRLARIEGYLRIGMPNGAEPEASTTDPPPPPGGV